jgi:hypothetical protein
VTPSLRAVLADSVQFRCGVGNRDLQVVNPDDAPSEVTVRVFPAAADRRAAADVGGDGERDTEDPLFAETFTVAASSSVAVSEVVASAGRYRVAVTVGDEAGETVAATWTTCPPRGSLVVVVSETGVSSVRVGSDAVTTNPVGR